MSRVVILRPVVVTSTLRRTWVTRTLVLIIILEVVEPVAIIRNLLHSSLSSLHHSSLHLHLLPSLDQCPDPHLSLPVPDQCPDPVSLCPVVPHLLPNPSFPVEAFINLWNPVDPVNPSPSLILRLLTTSRDRSALKSLNV